MQENQQKNIPPETQNISENEENNLVGKLPDDIKHWIDTCGIESLSYTVYVYRIQKRQGVGQRGRLFVNQYDNYVPEFKDLGTMYGAGLYELFVRWYDEGNKSHSKKLTINLDDYWTEIKEENDKKKKQQNLPVNNQPSFQEQFQQNLLMIRAITESISPILGASNKPSGENDLGQFSRTMELMGTMQNQMLKNNFQNQLELQKTMLSNTNYNDIQEEKDDGYIGEIIGLLGQFLPVLKMMSENQIRPVAKKYVDSDERLKAVLSDPVRAQQAYEKLKEKHGEETANRTFRAFGMLKNDRLVDRMKNPTPETIEKNTKTATKKRTTRKKTN
jgi:hypothetical protein